VWNCCSCGGKSRGIPFKLDIAGDHYLFVEVGYLKEKKKALNAYAAAAPFNSFLYWRLQQEQQEKIIHRN